MKRENYGRLGSWLKILGCISIMLTIVTEPVKSQGAQPYDGRISYADASGLFYNNASEEDKIKSVSLNKVISVYYDGTTLKEVLLDITQKAGLELSYGDQLVPLERKINLNLKQVTVYEVLWKVLDGTGLRFAISPNNHLVLMKRVEVELQRAQETVRGQVTDANSDETMPGVNIILKGTTTGTSTDSDGNYELSVPSLQDTLVFSFIGYQTQEVPIDGRTIVNVMLAPQTIMGEEMVVVGYGTQKKINLTGSVSTVSSTDLTQVPTANVTTALAGKLPGLITVQRSGEPGNDNADLSIRGFEDPLVVVDGIVGRDFNRLNPEEIESVTILKDAASAAVYGVSGGNGVILVTTKKGTIGKPEFGYTMNYGVQTVTNYPRFVNSAEFAVLKNEASINTGGELVYSPDEIAKFRDGIDDPAFPNFDYYDYFVRDYVPQLNQNITVSGGSERIRYFFLLGQTKQEAMWEGGEQDYSKYNFRTNVDANITDNLDVSLVFGARTEKRNNLVQNSFLMASWLQYAWPIEKPKTPDGKTTVVGRHTPYLDPDLSGYIADTRNIFQGNLTINYEIPFVEGLSAKVTAAQDLYFREEKDWRKRFGIYSWNEATQTSFQTGTSDDNTLQLSDWKESSIYIQTSLNYSRSFFDKHNISALLLYEESESSGTNFWARRIGYVVPIDQLFAGPNTGKNNYGGAFNDGRQSLVGRLNYVFQDKYLFEYSFRYDGSAKFPLDKRWGYFSGFSVGWRLSEENFIKESFSSIDNLMVRGSWGKLGDDDTGDFQFLSGYSYPSEDYILGNNIVTSGMTNTGVPNPNITWEESETFNLGVDLSMWNGLFEVKADVFYRQREGILAQRNLQLPSTFGASLPDENLNSDNTRGFEFEVRHNNSLGEISYSISTNISFTRSKWDHVEQREFTSQYDRWRNNNQGRWKNIWWGLKAIGQFTSQEDINSSPIQDDRANSTLLPGDIKYEDFNDDGVIDDSDYQIIGRGQNPEIYYGLGLDLAWRNFAVNTVWQGAGNFYVNQESYLRHPFHNNMSTFAYFMDRWHRRDMTDPDSEWIPGKYPSTRNSGAPNNDRFSSFWLKETTYLRLKYLNVSYTTNYFESIGVPQLKVFLSGQNLLTFSGLGPIDPEAPSGRLSYYPQQKTYNIGIDITF